MFVGGDLFCVEGCFFEGDCVGAAGNVGFCDGWI